VGVFDRFRKKKKEKDGEAEISYVLVRRTAKGGMQKVMPLAEPVSIENIYESLEPGTYALHKYMKGQSGFEELWIHDVLGDEKGKEETTHTKTSPFAGLREYAQEMKAVRDDLTTVFETIGPMIGFQKVGATAAEVKQKTLIEQLEEAKGDQEKLNKIFPLAATGSGGFEKIPISGSIPAMLAYAPQVVDQALDMIEKRLTKMGLVEGEGVATKRQEEIIKLPPKPKQKEERKEEKTEEEQTEIDGQIKLPEKSGIKKVELGERKKKDDGKSREEQDRAGTE
jgi:ribosomal protein L12E/L44/L45/RPP1/RPP2